MKLLEYEAKTLLAKSGILTPQSLLITRQSTPNLTLPIVLKSQIPTGGRGKAGGVRIIEAEADLQAAIDELFALSIKGYRPQTILAEEKLTIAHEYYLSLVVDLPSAQIRLIAHNTGGVEVEANPADSYLNVAITSHAVGSVGEQLSQFLNLPAQSFVLQDLVENLYKCFVSNDATLLEINPLVFTTSNQFVAGDCKLELDNSAAFRHGWRFEDQMVESNFVTLDPKGNVATIANGAGLAMATVDAASDFGLKPANFLDIGGGSDTKTLVAAFERITQYPSVRAIVINIVAGISRCDQVAQAIIAAQSRIPNLPPLFIRLAGTNFAAGAELLSGAGIPILATVEECLTAAKHEVTE